MPAHLPPGGPDRHPVFLRRPDSYVAVNIQGTLHVLEAARDLDIERVVVTSTSEVYGTAQYTPIDEQHPAACPVALRGHARSGPTSLPSATTRSSACR